MFPPPGRWKQVGTVDPEREYIGFTSRFFLRSPLRVPAFMRQGSRITKQVAAAPGVVGWSLGANLPTLEFYTLSAWETPEDLRTFLTAGAHSEAASKLSNDMRRDSIFVQFKVLGKDLPLRWDDAIQRQDARLS